MDEPLFDASSEPNASEVSSSSTNHVGSPRPFLGIRFECCKTYGRIYRNAHHTAYTGKCPRCFHQVTVPIGDGGTSSRFFTAR